MVLRCCCAEVSIRTAGKSTLQASLGLVLLGVPSDIFKQVFRVIGVVHKVMAAPLNH